MSDERVMKKMLITFSLPWLIVSMAGCAAGDGPLRASSYFGGMMYSDPEEIGSHGYMKGGSNGILYTCNGGYIDLGHVRESADRVKFVADIINASIAEEKKYTAFQITEPCKYHIDIEYPNNWSSMSEVKKREISRIASINIAEYIAFKSLVWHETITWYGWSCMSVLPEKSSSFSWEDTYSDALGCRLGARALKLGGIYEHNIDRLLDIELSKLNPQPMSVAKDATNKIRGSWFSGGPWPLIIMKKRNFDVLDGVTSPWIVPGICDDFDPVSYTTPSFANTLTSGFRFDVKLEPRSSEGKMAARSSMRDGKISPETDYPDIIGLIRSAAFREAGPNVEKPTL